MSRITTAGVVLVGWILRTLFRWVAPRQAGAGFGRWLFRKKIRSVWISMSVIGMLAYFWVAFTGPRMRKQPHLVPYAAALPPVPTTSMPVELSPLWPDSGTMPIAFSGTAAIAAGKVYYSYYCVFCHGDIGKQVGPVGESFVPTPPNLGLPRIQAMSDSALAYAMVSGTAHVPLLPPVVPPQSRPLIAAYVKGLQQQGAGMETERRGSSARATH